MNAEEIKKLLIQFLLEDSNIILTKSDKLKVLDMYEQAIIDKIKAHRS